MKRIIILGLIAAMLIPGCGQTDSDKIVMTVSEYEALKEAAEQSAEETPTATPTHKPAETQTPTPTPTPTETQTPTPEPVKDDFKDGDLIGEWGGSYYEISYNDNSEEVTSEEPTDVFLAINSDGTWTAIHGGDKDTGTWEKASDSGRILSLINRTSDGESRDNGWSFGKMNGKFIYAFNDWWHYDVEMTKQ